MARVSPVGKGGIARTIIDTWGITLQLKMEKSISRAVVAFLTSLIIPRQQGICGHSYSSG